MNIKYETYRNSIIEAGKLMKNSNLVIGTWGNISMRIPGENIMAITPSGIDYDNISPMDIVLMDFQGNVIEGNKKPSIEAPLHAAIYEAREEINAIVHTHSEYCTALAITRTGIPGCAEDMVQIVGGDVRVSEYRLPGTKDLGTVTVEALKDRNAAILASHGCIGVAGDLKEAMKIVAVVEKTAKAYVHGKAIGKVVELTQEEIDAMRSFYLNKYGQK